MLTVCQTTDMSQDALGIDLPTSIGYRLKQAASALRTAMDAALRPLGLTVPQYSCLEQLSQRPGLSNSELARGTFVTRQSMNVLLQSLEREGLVTRADRAPSGRALPTELTPAGRERLRGASSAVRAVEMQMNSALSSEQQDELRHLLAACVAGLANAEG